MKSGIARHTCTRHSLTAFLPRCTIQAAIIFPSTLDIAARHLDRGRKAVMWSPIYEELHPRYAWMRDYLERIARPGRLAGRQDLDPIVFKTLLPYINLVDVEGSGQQRRFCYRLIGTMQILVAARNITGLYLEEAVLPEFHERIKRNMTACVEQKQPLYDAFAMPHPGRDFIRTERVYYPLSSEGKTVDTLLILNGYPDDEHATDAKLPPLPEPRTANNKPANKNAGA
jgi:hypothetical protein